MVFCAIRASTLGSFTSNYFILDVLFKYLLMQLCASHYIHVDIELQRGCRDGGHSNEESWLDKSDFSSHLEINDVTV